MDRLDLFLLSPSNLLLMAQKILVLDDEESYAQMLTDVLREHSYLVDMVTSPKMALEMLEDKNYGLIVSDFKMPVLDGADFLSQIRKINPELPVIMVSGLMNLPELIKVANMSITLVLEKPIDVPVFIEAVGRYVEKSDQAQTEETGQAVAKEKLMLMEGWVFNYPTALYYGSEAFSSKVFLQKLWDAVRYSNVVFLVHPPGTEVDRIAQEISYWKKRQAQQTLTLTIEELRAQLTPEWVARITQDPQLSLAVCVTGFEAITASQAAPWIKWITEEISAAKGASSIYFLYCIEENLWKDSESWLQKLGDFAEKKTVYAPPLKERLPDLATYLVQQIKQLSEAYNTPARATLPSELVPALLYYPWPGNYQEMMKVLKGWTQFGENKKLSLADFKQAIEGSGFKLPPDFSLKARLQSIQNEPLRRAYEIFQGNWSQIFFSLEVKKPLPPQDQNADPLDLLYPELIYEE